MSTEKLPARQTTLSGSTAEGGSPPDWWKAGTPCPVCGKPTQRRQRTCSPSCGARWRDDHRSPESEAARRAKISKTMKQVCTWRPNPVDRPEVRAKISATHKERGITFLQRGGNGRGPTRHELMLYQELVRLRPNWLWSLGYADSNGPRKKGLPTNYKIDIASLKWKVAVEVDGRSHEQRKAEDAKKTAVLCSRGWLVLRFTNQQVETNPRLVAVQIVTTSTRSR